MACEVPVVASRAGGLPEVIEDGVGGFLHPAEDHQAMADSGVALLTDSDLHARIARGAWRRVHERFCAEAVVPQYESFYREVLGRARQDHRSQKSKVRKTEPESEQIS